MTALDLSNDKLVFDDEFSSLSLRNSSNPNGVWDTQFIFGGRTLSSNNEAEFYIDPAYNNLGISPFTVTSSGLTITASPTPSNLLSQVQNLPYLSGLIESDKSFAQTYGYFEMKAKLPAGQGLWPAFWLLPADGSWPPEIDVMEVLGNQITTLYATTHSSTNGTYGQHPTVADMSQGYHTYGVDWEPNTITFYFDGQAIFSEATPADMHKPMYMIANLAVGGNGSWPGAPNSSTQFPAQMDIAYIKAYASANTVPDIDTAPAPSSGSTSGSTTTPPPTTTTTTTTPTPPSTTTTPPVTTVTAPSGDPPLSAAPVVQLTGGSSPGTLTADSRPTKFYSLNGHDTFVAGSGDETFLITNAETIVLPAVHGVETVQWWGTGSYTMPAGITNLTMMHSGTGIANDGTVRMVASPWGNTLVAGAGQDLLVGGNGADVFMVKGGTGSDTIANLGAGDKIDVSNSYGSFATAQQHMSQVGSDVVLDMGNGQDLILRGIALSSVNAGEFSFANPAAAAPPPTVAATTYPWTGDPALSAAPVIQLTGGSSPGTLTADSRPTKFYSLNGHDTFVAGSGDDTFLVTNAETIVLPAVHGVETVQWWGTGSYTMPTGITNLTMMHSGTGIANDGTVRMVASPWGNTLVAGAGQDLLVGGNGADVFMVKGGGGTDTIANLGAGDKIVVSHAYADFATAQQHMTQIGSDVHLDLGYGHDLILRGVSLSSVNAGEFTFSNPSSLSQYLHHYG